MRVEQVDGPGEERPRPRTAGQQNSFRSIDVQIPHYNLGSPHFSPNGTPFLYGASSLHVPSIQVERGSSPSVSQETDHRWLWPSADPKSFTPPPVPSRRATPSVTSVQVAEDEAEDPTQRASSLSLAGMFRLTITPGMYDILSFPPGSEDPSVVRYDKRTQEITAAIPARIISQITSAKFVDYHLLSDFFLTFRLFMPPSDLVAHLVARLRWAIDRDDDTGKVVRVRTFVAIRHWLLNYFADDFIPSLPLREDFAKAMNDLSNAVRDSGHHSDMKIMRELKRCWRRTCALYWDTPAGSDVTIDQDILPGGPPGARFDTGQPQSTLLRPQKSTPRLESLLHDHSSGTEAFIQQVVGASVGARDPREKPLRSFSQPGSKTTNESARSPSPLPFPPERPSKSQSASAPPKIKQPSIASTDALGSTEDVAKKYRPTPHKRSGSFSDALRDTRQPLPLPKSIARSTHLLLALPYTGSLVRGNLFPPTPAFVEAVAPATPVSELPNYRFLAAPSTTVSSSTTMHGAGKVYESSYANKALAGPGMKKFLGSVRRALSGKVGGGTGPNYGAPRSPVPTARPARGRSPLGPSPENLSLSKFVAASASGNTAAMFENSKAGRIDLLGAGVVEAFQRAMYEEMSSEDVEWSSYDGEHNGGSSNKDQTQLDGANDIAIGLRTGAISMYECSTHMYNDFPPSPLTARPSVLQRNARARGFQLRNSEISSRTNAAGDMDDIYGQETPHSPRSSTSRLARRSKSFSFERTPSLFNQSHGIMRGGPAMPPQPEVEGKPTAFADAPPLRRVRSGLNQHSSTTDDNSETFSYTSSSESRGGGNLQPTRMLRRRPGGDLRAAATIKDLDARPKSTGSIVSGNFSTVNDFGTSPHNRPTSAGAIQTSQSPLRSTTGIISLGAVAKGGGVPVLQQHSARAERETGRLGPATKASFEAGVQKLRDLPDFESDDGGIEVALMKLEGTYQRRSADVSSPVRDRRGPSMSLASGRSYISQNSLVIVGDAHSERTFGLDGPADDDEHMRRMRRRHKQVFDHVPLDTPPILEGNSVGTSTTNISTSGVLLVTEQESSNRDLGRGLSIDTWQFGETVTSSNQSVPGEDGGESTGSAPLERRGLSPRPSPHGSDLRRIDTGLAKYLEEESDRIRDDASELSSEISFEMIHPASNTPPKFPPMHPGTIIAELGIPSHPLRHPPSPPLTLEKTLTASPNIDRPSNRQPRSPLVSPRAETFPRARSVGRASVDPAISEERKSEPAPGLQPTPIHLPFILAYDSELLAKQFTLIEKDALMEVDWKELVELRWSQTGSCVRDWVEFLNSKDTRGVEVVIARFNLVSVFGIGPKNVY